MMDIITGRAPPPARAESHLSKGSESESFLKRKLKELERSSREKGMPRACTRLFLRLFFGNRGSRRNMVPNSVS